MKRISHILLFLTLSVLSLAETYSVITKNGQSYYLYEVQKSEGFYAVSKRFNLPQTEIMKANPGSEAGLQLGQVLLIPVTEATQAAVKALEAPAPAPSDQPTQIHVVQPKETLYSLAKRYGTTVDGLLRLNPSVTTLQIGFPLVVPANAPVPAAAQPSATNHTPAPAAQSAPAPAAEPAKTPEQLARDAKTASKRARISGQVSRAFKQPADSVVVQPTTAEDTPPVIETGDSIPVEPQPVITDPEQLAAVSVNQHHITIAVLMPFMLDAETRDSKIDRFVDFYKGCLIALDSLKKEGISFDVYCYDTGKSAAQLNQVLQDANLKKADLIIGPAYQSQIPYVSTFSSRYKIPMVVPFSTNTTETEKNKYLFQVLSPQKELYGQMSEAFCNQFADREVVIFEPTRVSMFDKIGFADTLIAEMKVAGIPYHILNSDTIATLTDSIANLTERSLMVVMPSTNKLMINQFGEQMSQVTHPDVEFFGFQEWHVVQMKEIYDRTLYSCTNYHTNYTQPRTKAFFRRLVNRFGVPDVQQTPNYALFGYDITLFFGEMIATHGKDFRFFLPDETVHLLQMSFRFERIQPEGGYINRGVMLQRFDRNGLTDY
ncbi:MAG: LysM peptidoglycan-binding domain-containing protein [Paludibacteraceae bacterium]|nr:LysM peptidoglycan-binding domain-containing protein [Paludibacteraceae bacterium]